MTDFTPIKKLRLKQAFNDVLVFQEITSIDDFLKELFDVTKRGHVYVWDDDSKGYSVYVYDTNGIGSNRVLDVINSDSKDLFLWRIDGVMYKDSSKCDCALLNKETLCFVEFKSKAQNRSKEQAQFEYEKASRQISSVLRDVLLRYESIGIDIKTLVKLRAVAVFNKTVPAYNATQKSVRRKFEKQHKDIPFEFTNRIEI